MSEQAIRIQADFNGLFGEVLCLAHDEGVRDEGGRPIEIREGMIITAFDKDADADGNPDDLIATGIVARPPSWLTHTGSCWVLLIDADGVSHESDLADGSGASSAHSLSAFVRHRALLRSRSAVISRPQPGMAVKRSV